MSGYKLYQMKLHEEQDIKLRKALAAVVAAHQAEVVAFEAGLPHITDQEEAAKAKEAHRALLRRGRKITIHNLIRVVLDNGMPSVDSPKNALALLSKYGIGSGRPPNVRG